MERERYAQVKQVFREALRWPPEHRATVVDALAADGDVRAEALSLLSHHIEAPEDLPGGAEEAAAGQTLAELLRGERASGAGTEAGAGGAGTAAGGATAAAAVGWPLERVVRTLDPIARELAAAAVRGETHGSIRADHVLLDGETARLAGWARGARIAERIDAADAASAAPEQLSPSLGPVGPWTDVYALALLCVELMLGRPPAISLGPDRAPANEGPREGSIIAAALARMRDEAARPTPRAVGLDVPDPVEAALARALAMRPMERYQDAGRFWAALRDSLAARRPVPPPAPPPHPPPPLGAAPSKLRYRAWALGAAVLVIAGAAAAIQRCA